MKKIALLALITLPVLAFAQEGKFTIQGTVGTFNAPAKIYLERSINNQTVIDSVVLKDGHFQLSGTTQGNVPMVAYLLLNTNGNGPRTRDYKDIYLEQGIITVNSPDMLHSAAVAGTRTNDEKIKYNAATKPVSDAYAALNEKMKATPEAERNAEAFQKELHKTEKAIDAQSKQIDKKFIQENPDSYINLNLLQNLAYSSDYPEINSLFNTLSPKIKGSENMKKFAALLPKMKAVAIGAPAPEITEADTSGKMISLSSFRGKYVLVDFWTSWCGPCRAENPNVVKAYNRYKNKKFTIVGVSLDQPGAKAKWLDAIKHDGLAWTQLSDLKFWNSQAAGLYAVRAIPQNFLIDPKGKIVAKNLRGEDLDNKLEELFGKIL